MTQDPQQQPQAARDDEAARVDEAPLKDARAARWRGWLAKAAIFGLAMSLMSWALWRAQPSDQVQQRLAAQVLMRDQLGALDASIKQAMAKPAPTASPTASPTLALRLEAPEDTHAVVRERLSGLKHAQIAQPSSASRPEGTLHLTLTPGEDGKLKLRASLERHEQPSAPLLTKERRMGSWTALLPPLVAVLMALLFKRLIVALLAAVWLGAALHVSWLPHVATWELIRRYLVGTLLGGFNLQVIGFTVSLVGMVHVMLRMGGLAGLLERLSLLARGRRSTKLATALMGAAIFFDDYANTVVVGSTMRPLTDARQISREKLAYLVDSTSAPIAGLAIVSTWIGYEVGLFQEMSDQLNLGLSGYGVFFEIMPLRFYCLLTLCFVVLSSAMGRDFGPMLRAERRARLGATLRPGSKPLTQVKLEALSPDPDAPKRWYNAVLPIGAVLLTAALGMFWSGWRQGSRQLPSLPEALWGSSSLGELLIAWGQASGSLGSLTAWREALSQADNAKILLWSAVTGSLLAMALAWGQRLLTPKQALVAWLRAIPGMWMAITILVLAWAIRAVCDDLGTSLYLVGAIQGWLEPQWLPLLTFGMAAIVAFSTGTSWGTMGILLPAMIPLAHMLTQGHPQGGLLLMLCFGAVLDGAIFGDHCSPISDTTVMSSISSQVDHLDHVRTQIPYAVTTMLLAAGFGYVGVALGLTPWVALGLGALTMAALLRVVGRAS